MRRLSTLAPGVLLRWLFSKFARGLPGVELLLTRLVAGVCGATLISVPGYAQSASAARLADQYVRTDFTTDDGLPDNTVNYIAQTANGQLWVGTGGGLASFDGREFTRIELSSAGSVPQGEVHALLVSAQGDLWVGTDAGIVFIPKMALDKFNPALHTIYQLGSESKQVHELAQTREGDVWAGANDGLYRFQGGHFVKVIALDGVYRINQALNGNLLVIGGGKLLEWDGHRIIPHPGLAASLGVNELQIYQAFQDPRGLMWYATVHGLIVRGPQPPPRLQPADIAATSISRIIRDPDGRMWVTSRLGLFQVDGNHLESPAPGLSSRAFYAGRDGDLWIGTNGYGLVHLRRRVVRMFTTADGLPSSNVMAVFPAHDGTLWIAGNCGFSSFDGSKFRNWTEKDGLLNPCVWALAEDPKHDLWIGTYGGGAFRMHDGKFVEYSKEQGLPDRIVTQIVTAHDGSLWFATPEGLSHLQDGHFRNYTIADGLSSNQILSVHQDRNGKLWVATQTGLDLMAGDRFLPFPTESPQKGRLSSSVFEDSAGNLYTGESPKGISLLRGDALVEVSKDLNVRTMVESPGHDLWFAGKNGVIRLGRDYLINSVQNRDGPLDYEILDRSDGLASTQCSVGFPNIAFTSDGKLWVATVRGLAMIDLARRPRSMRRPTVFVGGITVGQTKELAAEKLTLPPGTHHLELHLEAVDLASPEKVRMQYRMDDVDPFWLDADSSRTAVYSNLPSGTHTFHIRASSSDGIWDRTGMIYKVTQRPYFYQTIWFLLLTLTLAILLLTGAYHARVRHVLRLAQMRMAERIAERERIARDLHDTLLQGVLSASMQLDVVEDHLAEDSAAKPRIHRVLEMLRQLTEEGRTALRGLRTHDTASGDLAVALLRVHQEVLPDEKVSYRVIAPNVPRALNPQIRDEVYRIGREAVLNAFLHAKASQIEVEIENAATHLRLVVRDDGVGIDSRVLQSGREGHWGLPGMRERAERIGGFLGLRSRPGAGTEIDPTVPAAIAFEDAAQNRFSRWTSWLSWQS
jgi:signal transduction histidine kinase/ligand-binding sensor domain-containing protein